MVTVHAPAWTKALVRAVTPNNESMVTVHAPAWTRVVVCAGTPHNKLRVTIRAPARTEAVGCVGTPSQLSVTCIAAVRGFLVDRYIVHRHLMCVVIRMHLDTRLFPVGVERVVVCAGTPNNTSMVIVYAPAWTTVVVCAGTPHNKLRVTIHAPAWMKVVVCVGTASVTICDVYRRRTLVSRRPLCCAPARYVCRDTHAS